MNYIHGMWYVSQMPSLWVKLSFYRQYVGLVANQLILNNPHWVVLIFVYLKPVIYVCLQFEKQWYIKYLHRCFNSFRVRGIGKTLTNSRLIGHKVKRAGRGRTDKLTKGIYKGRWFWLKILKTMPVWWCLNELTSIKVTAMLMWP